MSNGAAVMEMETREDPRFVQFTTGEVIEGTLLKVEPVLIKDKRATRYTVQIDDGSLISFLGTWQINSKLRPDDRGHRISVHCIGEDTMVKRGENCMKIFEVQVSKKRVDASNSALEITDDDIPF
jgi:hypothetical protein